METYVNANALGFSSANTGAENAEILQKILDRKGTVVIAEPGCYKIAKTVYIGSDTTLKCTNGVFLCKTAEIAPFCNVILNRGALCKTYDRHIVIENLGIQVNGVDCCNFNVFGLRGQLAFHYADDVKITGFRCYDLGKAQFAIHICTFHDVIIEDAIIKGDKDGIHFGRGSRFTVRNCVFETEDDAVALNAHDYDTSNPELGWIENGIVENCFDLADSKNRPAIGYFCRILSGTWVEWFEGMEVQKSDTVISCGRLYRVSAEPDGKTYISKTRPTHESGKQVLDGITWVMVQYEPISNCAVRNVIFRNIFLEKPRIPFSLHYDTGRYSRSYYPGGIEPVTTNVMLDCVNVQFTEKIPFINTISAFENIVMRDCITGNCTVSDKIIRK